MNDFDLNDPWWRTYWAEQATTGSPAEPLDRPCEDCAVTCGFYAPYTESLALETEEIQRKVSERWFCHLHHNRACRGNINLLEKLNGQTEVDR